MTTTRKPKNDDKNKQSLLLIGIIVAAVVVAGVAIVLSSSNTSLSSTQVNYDEIPQSRTEDGAFLLGDPDATVTFVLFEDFLCPHCQAYQGALKEMMQELIATGEANFEFRMVQTNSVSYIPFGLAECAEELQPGSFWHAHDTLFELAASQSFNEETPRTFAERMDIPYGDLLTCQRNADQYETDGQFVQQFEWFSGTPAVGVRINDGPVQQNPLLVGRPTVEQYRQVVEAIEATQ